MTTNTDNKTATTTVTKGKNAPGLAWQDCCDLLERVTTDRYDVKAQAAFLKVTGPQGHRLYIAKQEVVRRIDLTFKPDGIDGIVPIRKDNGSAKWELDTTRPEALTCLEQVLLWMADAKAETVEKRKAFVPSVPKAIAQRRAVEASDPKAKEERAERIRAVAREKGVEVSPNADI